MQMKAFKISILKPYELRTEGANSGSEYKLVSVNYLDRVVEERVFDFQYGGQIVKECMSKNGNPVHGCPSPVLFNFCINMRFYPDIRKVTK